MNKLRVRLLGGFEVWSGDRQVTGFESQKVRALLAYLVCHRKRSFSRDSLAGLLWPESSADGARHALRQAIYSLRTAIPEAGGYPLLLSSHLELGLNPQADCWVDVEAFEAALRQGTERQAVDLHHLTSAAQLYRGEFLAGFFVKESPAFEEWLVTEQVRLREAAVDTLRKLIDSYRRRGEHRFGVHYARRLVGIEPLSEEAHRELMRLFALSGQRNRALAQYEELQNVLRSELGVEPLAETRRLYESILAEGLKEEAAHPEEPIGPLVPLAGRQEAFAALRDGWSSALAGTVHFTLVTGEGGIGKTRLVKSFLDVVSSRRQVTVLKGCCYEMAPLVAYQPFIEVLCGALTEEPEAAEKALAVVSGTVVEDLVRLVPELRELRPELPLPAPLTSFEERRRLFGSIGRFLEGLRGGGVEERGGDPLILFLDDLHLADQDTLDLLAFLAAKLDQGPLWIVAACRSTGLDREHPLNQIVRRGERTGAANRVEVDRLSPEALDEIAESLVGEAQAAELCRFLEERSQGLPLVVTELINFLWDEGVLAAGEGGSWTLARSLEAVELAAEEIEELVRIRVRRLPNSTRRLASLAAIMGQSFDAQILQEAAEEHPTVVEVGLELMLRRWLVRQFAQGWTGGRRERDIVLWAKGARGGTFEFAHPSIRSAIYHELNPIRRQAMHGQVAEALEKMPGERSCEALAYHFAAAGQWEKTLVPLEQAIARARAVLAGDTARRYCDQLLDALTRLVASARNEARAERWREERSRIEEIRERVAQG
jgi:DNA-binding SARP family transcriptional activator